MAMRFTRSEEYPTDPTLEPELQDLLKASLDNSVGALHVARIAIDLGYGIIGNVKGLHEHTPHILQSAANNDLELTGWRPTVVTENGGSIPFLAVANDPRLGVLEGSFGSRNHAMEREAIGLPIIPDMHFDLGTHGAYRNPKAQGGFDAVVHRLILAATHELPKETVLGGIDIVRLDPQKSADIGEPSRIYTRYTLQTLGRITVRAGDYTKIGPIKPMFYAPQTV